MELVRILEMDDEIYVTGRFEGTHTGDLCTPLGPVAASGKGLDLLFVDYSRVANERIVECEIVRDRLGMMIQLGRGSGSDGANLSASRAHRRGAPMDSSEDLDVPQRQRPRESRCSASNTDRLLTAARLVHPTCPLVTGLGECVG